MGKSIVATVFVTGGTGYIGGWLIQALLEKGFQVVALARTAVQSPPASGGAFHADNHKNLHWVAYDGGYECIERVFAQRKISAVFHLAACVKAVHTPQDIPAMLAVGLTLGTQLLEAMKAHGCNTLINTGTYWQYAADGTYLPNTLYAAFKQAYEAVMDFYVAKHGLKAMTLVLYDVYGPKDARGKFLHHLIRTALEGEPVLATAGEQKVDFVHVSDVCAGFLQAERWLQAQPAALHTHFALDTKERPSLRDAGEEIIRQLNVASNVSWGSNPYPAHQIFTPALLPRLPGWQAHVTLKAGIRELIQECAA